MGDADLLDSSGGDLESRGRHRRDGDNVLRRGHEIFIDRRHPRITSKCCQCHLCFGSRKLDRHGIKEVKVMQHLKPMALDHSSANLLGRPLSKDNDLPCARLLMIGERHSRYQDDRGKATGH
jgi:hypothetical protein